MTHLKGTPISTQTFPTKSISSCPNTFDESFPKEEVGCPNPHKGKGRSLCVLQVKNSKPYTSINLEYCDMASSIQMNVVANLPIEEVLESSFCDTLCDVTSREDQTLVVCMQDLVDRLDDEIDSSYKNDLCPSSSSTYNLNKVP